MRVVITTGIYPPDVGGPATYVPQCAEFLRNRGHDVTVVTLADHPCDLGDRVQRIARGVTRPSFVGYPVRWRRVMRALSGAAPIDVVLAAGLFDEAALWSQLHGVPLVSRVVADAAWERATARGLYCGSVEEFQDARGVRIKLLHLERNLAIRCSLAVIVPSRHVGDLVVGWGVDRGCIHVIPNGVDVGRLLRHRTSTEPTLQHHTKDAFRLLYVGRLTRVKGVHRIIEALGELGDRFVLDIVGNGPEEEALRFLARGRGLERRVTFHGPQDRERTADYVAAADALVLASDTEGLSHAAIEAMVIGTPVVASAVGGNLELLEDGRTGLLFPPSDTQALASKLRCLANDPALSEKLVGAAARIGARYDIEPMLSRAEELLYAVAQGAL